MDLTATIMPVPTAAMTPAPVWILQGVVGYVRNAVSVTMASSSVEEHVCRLRTADAG